MRVAVLTCCGVELSGVVGDGSMKIGWQHWIFQEENSKKSRLFSSLELKSYGGGGYSGYTLYQNLVFFTKFFCHAL